mgnify:CR=1 FL=1
MKPGAENQVSFSEIRIQDGVLTYEDAANHVSETLGDIDLSLAWPSISRSFAATGQFDWRGERIDGSISVSDFRRRAVRRPVRPEGAAGQRAAETGLRRHRRQSHQHDDGRHADRRQPRRCATPCAGTGQAPPGGGGSGRFALKARANVVGASVALTNVNVELDGNVAEGVMTLRQQRPPDAAGDARRRRARLHALYLHLPPARQRRARLEPAAVRSELAVHDRPRHAPVGGEGDGRLDQARPHRVRRKPARRRAGAVASARRRCMAASPRARSDRALRRGRRRQGPVPVHRRRSASLRQRIVRHQQSCPAAATSTSRWWRPGSSPFGLAQSLDGTATLTGHDGADRRLQCRAAPEAAGAPAAVRRRQFPLRLDALRQPDHRAEIQRRHRHRRGYPRRSDRRRGSR